MGLRVETFEKSRRDRDREGTATRALAARYGVHRRAVRQALAAPLPPVKRKPVGRPAPKLGPYRDLIDSWLDGDRDAPRKQRHTAKRVWERLRDEHAADVAERTVREYVHDRRAERGEGVQAFVPQVHGAGVEAEVDWGEAQVAMAGSAARVYLFHMRACHSGAAFAMAFPHCSQQAFLEAHVHAFDWFGGVFGLLRYDNLGSAVKQVLRGRRRVETDRFIALRSHYLYESQFTTPGIEGAHEKGGVEGEVGRFRRRHFVPVPDVSSLGELNARMLAGCETDLLRRITGRQETVGESFARERPLMLGRRNWIQSRWSRSSRIATPCPSGWPACGFTRGSALARSSAVTAGSWSLSTSASKAVSVSARHSTITWSCSPASRARWPGRSRSPRRASAAPGPRPSMSCGARSPSATDLRRPRGK